MKIYLATGNQNKKREMAQILKDHSVVIPSDEGIDFDPEETGSTFYENSLIKALALWNIVHCPVIADDSGICVDALDGAPGIYSARYAGPEFMQGKPDGSKVSQEMQNRYIIEQTTEALKSGKDTSLFPNGPRSCHYTCSMVLVLNPSRFFIAQETMEGSLLESIEEARGNGGFGYDPIVFIPGYGKTAAELSAEEKNSISHRGKACRKIEAILNSIE